MGRKKNPICPHCHKAPKVMKLGLCRECNGLKQNIKHKQSWDDEKILSKIEWHYKEIRLLESIWADRAQSRLSVAEMVRFVRDIDEELDNMCYYSDPDGNLYHNIKDIKEVVAVGSLKGMPVYYEDSEDDTVTKIWSADEKGVPTLLEKRTGLYSAHILRVWAADEERNIRYAYLTKALSREIVLYIETRDTNLIEVLKEATK